MTFTPPLIAHRGVSAQAPENTIAAFMKAKQKGLKWVEFDVMLAKTGEAVVIHDDELDRTSNGKGMVIESTYDYLKTLDAGSWFSPEFANEKIPSLEEILLLLHQQHMAANLEIKPLPGYEEITVKRIFEILQENQAVLPSPLLLSSFSRVVLRAVRKKSSTALLGMLMHEWQLDWQEFSKEVQCTSVNVNQAELNPERVKAIKEAGYLLLSYTVDTVERAEELLSWGVDAIFSDCPGAMLDQFNICQYYVQH